MGIEEARSFSSAKPEDTRKLSSREIETAQRQTAPEHATTLSNEALDAKIVEIVAAQEATHKRRKEILENFISKSGELCSRIDMLLEDVSGLDREEQRYLKGIMAYETTNPGYVAESLLNRLDLNTVPESTQKVLDPDLLNQLLEYHTLGNDLSRITMDANPYIDERQGRANGDPSLKERF